MNFFKCRVIGASLFAAYLLGFGFLRADACDDSGVVLPSFNLNIPFDDFQKYFRLSLGEAPNFHLFDLKTFTNTQGSFVSSTPVAQPALTWPQLAAINSVALQYGTSATSYDAYMAQLAANKNSYTIEQKLAILITAGNTLANCYDYTDIGGMTSMEQIFQSAKSGGSKCGVCRDIHSFLANMAGALGMPESGTQTLDWQKGKDGGGAHAIAQFKDPQTGNFYVINYNQIFNTNQKTVQGANDVATRLLAPLSSASYIESAPGQIHLRQPTLSTWVRDSIETQSSFDYGNTLITSQIGADGNYAFGLQIPLALKLGLERDSGLKLGADLQNKVFLGANHYVGSDGTYQLEFSGWSGNFQMNVISDDAKAELKLITDGYFGGSHLSVPTIAGSENFVESVAIASSQSQDYQFNGLKIAGIARLDPVTAKISLEVNNTGSRWSSDDQFYTGGGSYGELKLGLDYQPWDWLTISPERMIQNQSIKDFSDYALRTAWDKISIIADTRGKSLNGDQIKRAYLAYNGSLYIFDGIEKSSAFALRNQLKEAFPSPLANTEMSILFDANFMVANPSKDPYYNVPLSLALGIDWKQKILDGKVDMEASVGATLGSRPFYLTQYDPTITALYPSQPDTPANSDMSLHLTGSLDFKL